MGLIFCIAMTAATAHQASADVPLEAPSIKKKKPATLPVTVEVPAPTAPARHWLVGLTGALMLAPSGPLRVGGSARLSLGYVRPDDADHLGISLEPEIAFAGNGEPGAQKSSAFLFSLPLLLSYNVATRLALLRVMVGPSLDYFAFHRTGSGSGESLGFEAGVAYLFNLVNDPMPNHALGIDVRFHYLPDALLGEKTNEYLISIGASYAFIH